MKSTSKIAALAALLLPLLAGAQGRERPEEREFEDVEARDEWFWSLRSFPTGVRPYDAMLKAREIASRTRGVALLGSAPPFTGTWRALGPFGLLEADAGFFNSSPQMDAGRVVGIAPPRTAGAPLFIATASGGIWKSPFVGGGWQPTTDNACSLNMGAVAVDPRNSSIVYAGTGEFNSSSLGCGVLRSTDGGATWTGGSTGRQVSTRYSSIVIDAASAGSTTSSIVLAGSTGGLLRSANSGATFTTVLAGGVSSVIAHPTRAGVYYASNRDQQDATRRGIYKSTDAGLTWSLLPQFPVTSQAAVGRAELAISPAAPDQVFALVADVTNSKLLGLFQWNEATQQWTTLAASGIYSGAARADFGTQSSYDLAIAVDPRNAKRVYIAGVRAFRSTDGGATFRPMADEIHCDWHNIIVDPRNPDVLYAGTDGGFFMSTDAGDSWISYNAGLSITQYYPGISVSPKGTIVMGGSQDNGAHQWRGTVYWDGFSGGDGGYTAINHVNPDIAWGEAQWSTTSGSAIYRRAAGVRVARNTGIDKTDRAQFIPPLVMDPVNPQKLYFGTHRLYQTVNEGALWTPISVDLTRGTGRITTIAIAPSDTATIYVGTTDGNFMTSHNGGATFDRQVGGLPTASVTDIAIDPASPNHVAITFQGFGNAHVFETSDGGVTWRNITGNLVDAGANAVEFVGASNIFVGTDVGVFQTADDGVTWVAGPLGMPNVVVMDLEYSPAANLLVAATYGRGMFSYQINGVGAVLRGDVNSDGKVDAADALLIQQALVSGLSQSVDPFPRGDANCNGVLDSGDVVLVLRAAVGLPTPGACVGTTR